MKKIFYIEKHMKIFQICEKLSKIIEKSQRNLKSFFKKKNDLLKNKIHQKIKYFSNNFLFFFKFTIFFILFSIIVRCSFLTKFN